MTMTEEEVKRMKENIPRIAIPPLEGSIVHYQEFPSELVRPRPVDVWLPEGYDADSVIDTRCYTCTMDRCCFITVILH